MSRKFYAVETYGVMLFCDDCDEEMVFSSYKDGCVHICKKCKKEKVTDIRYPTTMATFGKELDKKLYEDR